MNCFLSCGYLTKQEGKCLPLAIAYYFFVQKFSDNIKRKSLNLLKFHLRNLVWKGKDHFCQYVKYVGTLNNTSNMLQHETQLLPEL